MTSNEAYSIAANLVFSLNGECPNAHPLKVNDLQPIIQEIGETLTEVLPEHFAYATAALSLLPVGPRVLMFSVMSTQLGERILNSFLDSHERVQIAQALMLGARLLTTAANTDQSGMIYIQDDEADRALQSVEALIWEFPNSETSTSPKFEEIIEAATDKKGAAVRILVTLNNIDLSLRSGTYMNSEEEQTTHMWTEFLPNFIEELRNIAERMHNRN